MDFLFSSHGYKCMHSAIEDRSVCGESQ